MTKSRQHLLFVAALFAACCAPVGAQSLALTYQLAGSQVPGPSISNSGCAGFGGVASVGSCGQEALGRFSRRDPRDDQVRHQLSPASGAATAGTGRRDPDIIPYLGESGGPGPERDAMQTDFNLTLGGRQRPRTIQELERRFSDATQDARLNRTPMNALGFEVIVPIQSQLKQSADPALPQ